jgi:prevent-host-death family protein
MKTIGAGRFKNHCLGLLDEVARTRSVVVVTKRGKPVAKLVPVEETSRPRPLKGSVVRESGDPFSTGESWDADRS